MAVIKPKPEKVVDFFLAMLANSLYDLIWPPVTQKVA